MSRRAVRANQGHAVMMARSRRAVQLPGAAEKVSNFSKSVFGDKKDNEKKAAEEAARVKAAEKLEAERLLEVTDHVSHDLPRSLPAGGESLISLLLLSFGAYTKRPNT